MEILKTLEFTKKIKKLHSNQKIELDAAIMEISNDPQSGNLKTGDLADVHVYKFYMVNQLTLLSYRWYPKEKKLVLISLGTHENFYRKLKR